MNGLPYYKRYPRDFIEGTIGMPFELKGAYSVLLDLIYMQGGELPDDARYISGLLGCSSKQWTYYRKALIGLGKIEAIGGVLVNNRATTECELTENLRRTQRENRAKRGSQPSKNNGITATTVEPKPNHTDSESDTDKKEREAKASLGPRKRRPLKTQIPLDAVLGEDEWSKAEAKGLSRAEAEAQFARFRDTAIAAGRTYADWSRAWVNWLGSPYFRSLTTVTPFPAKRTNDAERLDDYLDAFKARLAVQRLE